MRRLLCFHVLFLTTSCAATSQDESAGAVQSRYGPVRGESLLTVGATFSQRTRTTETTESKTNSSTGQVGLGFFVTDTLELGGQLAGSLRSSDGNDSGDYGIFPYARLNARVSPRTWFYFGLHGGSQTFRAGDTTTSSLGYGVHGGVRIWTSPRTSLFIEPRFTRTDTGTEGFDQTLDEVLTILGLAVRL